MPALQWAVMEADLDPAIASEQTRQRPVLIVSNEEFNQAIPNITVLPMTSTQRRLYPAEVLVPKGAAGQPLDSIIMAHEIRTISKLRLRHLIGYLEAPELRRSVRDALRVHLDLE